MNKADTTAKGKDIFQLSWLEEAYLKDYYPEEGVPSDEVLTNQFFVDELKRISQPEEIAVIGVGPTCDDIILSAAKASKIYGLDYLERNLSIVKDWLDRGSSSRNWNKYTYDILRHEMKREPTKIEIEEREQDARKKTVLKTIDLREDDPLGPDFRGYFQVVIMPYCAESATDNKKEWKRMMHNASTLVAPGGLFLVGALGSCPAYEVGGELMPCANITADDMKTQLELDFNPKLVNTKSIALPEHKALGYEGIILGRAIRAQ